MNDKLEMLVRAVDSSLHQTTTLFTMLLAELYPDDEAIREVDTIPPAPQLVGHDNPILCQHPDRMVIMDQELCNSCGANLSG